PAAPRSRGLTALATGVRGIGQRGADDTERVVKGPTTGIGLSLPANTRVHIYTTREAFRRGLVQDAALGEEGADELAAFAIGIARPGRALLNGRMAVGSREWLRLVGHELTHIVQFDLAGGEGRAEQWLAEGMAEPVAFRVLERLASGSGAGHRRVALARVRQQPAFAHGQLDLSTLGPPRDFTLRHQREGSVETYHLTFLLADYLIERHGFDALLDYFARLKHQPSSAAFRSAFGYSIAIFEAQALAHLQAASLAAGD